MKTAIMMMRERGNLVYNLYKALTFVISPLIHLHLHYRRFRGLEHSIRWPERLGRPSLPRPPGPLIWFHAVSLGEGMAAIPVIRRCLVERPDFNILMTTTTLSAFEVLKHQLPPAVMYQFAPLDLPAVVNAFLSYWKPNAAILLESELWPNVVMAASESKITLSLLNARMSERSFRRWSAPALSPLIALMLSKFSLIVPLSTREAIHFQLLQAPPSIVSNSADLKYCVGEIAASTNALKDIEDLQKQLRYRQVWLASSVHEGELEVMLRVHETLVRSHSDLLTVIVPRHPRHALDFCRASKKQGLTVAVRSDGDKLTSETNIYVADTLGELREFYRLVPISLIGGSFLPTLAGHNISEAMVAGCAVLTVAIAEAVMEPLSQAMQRVYAFGGLIYRPRCSRDLIPWFKRFLSYLLNALNRTVSGTSGPHVGHFSHMVSAMQSFNPLSIQQVSGEAELTKVLQELLSNPISLEVRQSAAKQAFYALSCGVLSHVWMHLNWFVFTRLRIGVVK